MNSPNLVVEKRFRKAEILERYKIKNNAYYDRIKFLGIETIRTKEGSFLSSENVALMDELHQYIETTGKMKGFESSSFARENNSNPEEEKGEIVKSEETNIVQGEENTLETLEPETQTFNPDLDNLMRAAAELKANDLAMFPLVTRAIANEMSEDELPQDLKEKVNLAREVATPKSNPAQVNLIAKNLLTKYRNQGGN